MSSPRFIVQNNPQIYNSGEIENNQTAQRTLSRLGFMDSETSSE